MEMPPPPDSVLAGWQRQRHRVHPATFSMRRSINFLGDLNSEKKNKSLVLVQKSILG